MSRKRPAPGTKAAVLRERCSKAIDFIKTHYSYKPRSQHKILTKDVYAFYLFKELNTLPFETFHRVISSQGVNSRSTKPSNSTSYYISPLSRDAILYHNTHGQPPIPKSTKGEFHLLNIQGIATSHNNKSKPLQTLTKLGAITKFFAITETHLVKNHKDEEILKHFPNYTLIRADRNLE